MIVDASIIHVLVTYIRSSELLQLLWPYGTPEMDGSGIQDFPLLYMDSTFSDVLTQRMYAMEKFTALAALLYTMSPFKEKPNHYMMIKQLH